MTELPAIHEGLQDVLLDVEVAVDDGGQLGAQCRQILNGLLDAIVGDVVGRRLGAQVEMIADVLLDKAVAIMAADDRVGWMSSMTVCSLPRYCLVTLRPKMVVILLG
ncbi:MAG: hypothetical protein ACLQU2_29930 [Candidatus Binataceae bacterium]